ncbi:T9SS type A sorting domain-containing protein [Neolewinella agarilytica]|uniref:T9SS type A sorting domain-containing protein n=1 Tax=Neolewinella agarilytica TaxID=478744 RepID=UPI0023563F90|nr:T9SS type A sorting domain-containing protein [Neolewinella agarilytica]
MISCQEEDKGTYAVALRIFIIRKSDGTGSKADLNYQKALLEEIDAAFSPHRIYFLLNCISYIDDTFVYDNVRTNQEGSNYLLNSGLQDDSYVTLLIHGDLNGSGVANTGSNTAFAGAGIFDESIGKWRSDVVHELGHCLGLVHTHRGNGENGGIPDLVDGSTCCEAGDFICDTPPDPNNFANVLGSTDCTGEENPTLTDPSGTPYTNVSLSNYMSYNRFVCSDWEFTPEQGNAMRHVLAEGPGHIFTKRPDALFHSSLTDVTGSRTYDTDVRVIANAGVRFTDATIQIPPFRKIIVDAKSRLYSLGSTFTASDQNCGLAYPFWSGIEVAGNETEASSNTIISMTNSTISLANNGIYYPSIDQEKPVLPLIFLRGMTFTDNRVSLNLASDNVLGSIENQYWVQLCDDCDFTITDQYPETVLPVSSAIKLGYSRDFWCIDCDLQLPELKPSFAAVPAIDIVQTRLSLRSNCPSVASSPYECTGEEAERSSITNYQQAIRLTDSDNSHIINVDFNNVKNGILANTSPSLLVQNSTFDINNQNERDGFAILLANSPSFVIDKNIFETSELSNISSRAIVAINTGGSDAFISDNYYEDFSREIIYAIGGNSSVENGGVSGLRVFCNDFNNPDNNGFGTGPFDIGVFSGGSIARLQGDVDFPAGNKFSEGLNANGLHIRNQGNQLIEYAYATANNAVRAIPLVTSNVNRIESDNEVECFQFPDSQGDNIVGEPRIADLYGEVVQLLADLQTSSSPGVKEGIKRTLSRKNVQLSIRLVSQEKYLEKDTNSAANLEHLLSIAGMRQGYLATFHESLLRSRYGDYEAHKAFIDNASPPANSNEKFTAGFNNYRTALNIVEEANIDHRSLTDFSPKQLEQLGKMAADAPSGMGGGYSAGLLGVYYDTYLERPEESYLKQLNSEDVQLEDQPKVQEDFPKVTISPNPATDQIVIEKASAGSIIKIMDLQGRLLQQREATSQRELMSTGGLKAGVYLVNIRSRDGDTQTQRLIIQ